MNSSSYTARILCKLCMTEVALGVEGSTNLYAEAGIDAEVIRRARDAGICPVDMPHVVAHFAALTPPQKAPLSMRRVWICRECSNALVQAFSIDENGVDAGIPPLLTIHAPAPNMPPEAAELIVETFARPSLRAIRGASMCVNGLAEMCGFVADRIDGIRSLITDGRSKMRSYLDEECIPTVDEFMAAATGPFSRTAPPKTKSKARSKPN